MANLPVNSLQFFPVRYPGYMVAAGIPQENTKPHPRQRGATCPRFIQFRDDFNAPRGNAVHSAIDIFGAFDLEIVATTDGTIPATWSVRQGSVRVNVSGVGNSADGGNYVMIRDVRGYYHYYAHMRYPPLVRPEQTVRAGQLLGYLGDTGRARTTCQHLHYQVSTREGGLRFFNPYQELRRLARLLGARESGLNILIPI
jgi:murein DD-endopeptidase MepM/ murein hydrolase activator NlpD